MNIRQYSHGINVLENWQLTSSFDQRSGLANDSRRSAPQTNFSRTDGEVAATSVEDDANSAVEVFRRFRPQRHKLPER